jgi:effector-binding domain-containing protein
VAKLSASALRQCSRLSCARASGPSLRGPRSLSVRLRLSSPLISSMARRARSPPTSVSTLVTQSRRAIAPAGGVFSDEIFAKGRGAATIYIPCDGPIETIGRVRPYHAPEVDLATIVHAGSHRSIDLAYGALATHVARHDRAADGPLRERYLVGPLDTSDESAWRTEIGWPIVKDAKRPH